MSRLTNTIRNAAVGFGAQLIIILLNFINRTFFIQFLGAEYLGLSGLFSNILSMLSLAELGIGVAISFSLYKPLQEQNIRKNMEKSIFFLLFCNGKVKKKMKFFLDDTRLFAYNVSSAFL